MKKEDIYLDLSKCSQEEIKNVFKVLHEPKFVNQYEIYNWDYRLHLSEDGLWWVLDNNESHTKTEITYSQFMEFMKPQPTELETQITELLKGIDKDECEVDYGWWETSDGAKFGKDKLNKLIHLVSSTPTELEKEMFEFLEKVIRESMMSVLADEEAEVIIEKYKNKYGG